MSILHQPYIIGIAGGTASGKTTMALTIIDKIGTNRVAYINYDSYYKDLGYLPLDERFKTNFDHPDALDTDLMVEHLHKLRNGQSIEVPTYDFKTCTRLSKTVHIDPLDVIIVDGILALADERLREIYDLKIFVELSADERILRRLQRDVSERGRTIESVVNQYRDTVRPMHDLFVEPSKHYADIVVPGEASKSAALEAVAGQVLGKVELARRRSSLEILQKFSSTTSQETSHDLLSTIVQIAAQELSADNVTLHQYDSETASFLDPSEFSATWPLGGELQMPRKDGLSAYVINQGSIVVTDITLESNFELIQTAHLRETNTKAFLGIRLEAAGEFLGVLFLNYLKPRQLGIDEQNLANILGMYAAIAIHRNRLDKQMQAQLTKLKGLSEIGPHLLTVDYQTIKSEIVSLIAKELEPDNVTLHQYDSIRGVFLDPLLYSATWPAGSILQKPRKDGVSAYVLEHGAISITDIDSEKNQDFVKTAHLTQTGTKAFIGIRLEAGNEILGILFLNYLRPREFKQQEEALVNVLGTYAAIAIHRARLYEEIQLRTKRIQDLSEVAGILLSSDYEYVKEEIVRFAARELEADNVTLHQYDASLGDFLEPAIFSATWPSGAELQNPRKEGVSAYVVDHGSVMISNVDTEPNRELVKTAHLMETGTKAFIGIRLEAGGDVLGVLFMNYQNSQNFGADKQALVRVLSVYASAAILTARSYKRRLAERQAENLQIVNEIANALEVYVELDNFLQSLLEFSLSRLGAPRGSIQLLREENLELHASVGLEQRRSDTLISIQQGITGLAVREKRFIYEPDTSINASFLPYLGETRSEMAAPLSVGNMVVGVLNVEHPQPNAFDEEKQELFQLIASQASIIIHQKLRLDEEISKRQLAEQKALLTDIAFDTQHHIGNKVSMVRIRAMELLEDADLNLSTSQRRKLNIILNNAEIALKASKHVLEIRKPPAPEWVAPSTLIGEMLDLIDTVPEVVLRIDVPPDLPKVYVDKERTEYAIKDLVTNAQRAILNSGKNSGYVAITSRITQDKHYLELLFTNDGPPIPKTDWENIFKKGPGFGLPTAKALLQSQSGDIELLESDQNKTTFVVRFLI